MLHSRWCSDGGGVFYDNPFSTQGNRGTEKPLSDGSVAGAEKKYRGAGDGETAP